MKRAKRAHHQLLISCLALTLVATSFVPKSFEKSVEEAPLVVRGVVRQVNVQRVEEPAGGQNIYTYADLEIEEVLKGALTSRQIAVRELGGEKEGLALHIPGAAVFRTGEEVVLFLDNRPNPDSSYTVRGMMMGKYTLQKDETGTPVLTGGRIAAQREEHSATGDPKRRWTVEAVRDLIRTQATAKSPGTTEGLAAPSAVPAPTASPLQSSSDAGKSIEDQTTVQDSGTEAEAVFYNRLLILILGAIVGALVWFLRGKRKKH